MGKVPSWYKGRMMRCAICGFEYGEREGKLRKQRGILVDAACFDQLTEQQRQDRIKRR